MTLGKRISAWWSKLLCFFLGHTLTTVCTRCGKLVNLHGKKKPTLEQRLNNWWNNRNKPKEAEYKGSVKLKTGLKKYSLNMKTNELRLVEYKEEYAEKRNKKGEIIKDKDGWAKYDITSRKAKYDPLLVYIDAANDENAIRKANNYLVGVKPGIRITGITKPEEVRELVANLN